MLNLGETLLHGTSAGTLSFNDITELVVVVEALAVFSDVRYQTGASPKLAT
jgi:hypothetical protein